MKFFATTKLSENMRETPEGYLVCLNVPIARTGDMIYLKGELPGVEADNDGKIVVTRDASEVFRPETIASFEGKSLTLWHPSEFVEPKTWAALTKGLLQNVRRGTGANVSDLLADILVTDDRAIALVKEGMREVSCGYEADYIMTGIGRAIQKNIIGNHLAMVDEGRAGAGYAIMDHKGKGTVMTLTEKIKGLFSKAQDDALKLVQDVETTDKVAEKKEEPKVTLDVIAESLKNLGVQLDALKTKDLLMPPSQSSPAVAMDAGALEARLSKLEDAIAKLSAMKDEKKEEKEDAKDESKEEKKEEAKDESKEEQKEESKDEEAEESEESEDEEACNDAGSEEELEDGYEEKEESKDAAEEKEEKKESKDEKPVELTADEISRVEILAPGLKVKGKDAKAEALKVAFKTKDGKAVIEKFSKTPDFKNEQFVNAVFIGASEVLKATRSADFSKTKTRDVHSLSSLSPKGAMSAESLNKKMAEHYGKK